MTISAPTEWRSARPGCGAKGGTGGRRNYIEGIASSRGLFDSADDQTGLQWAGHKHLVLRRGIGDDSRSAKELKGLARAFLTQSTQLPGCAW